VIGLYELLDRGSLRVLRLPPPLKLHGRHDIAEILLKMALNTKIQIQIQILFYVRAKGIKDIKKKKTTRTDTKK
jgi:hypothetical protein